MILALALAVAVLFGSGAYLLVKRDLVRVVGGIVLMSNAANLFIVSTGLTRGREPIYPLESGVPVSDPLVQALVLTSIVITFGTAAVVLGLVYQVYRGTTSESIEPEPENPPANREAEDR